MTEIVGTVAMIVTIGLYCIGLPGQIRKNHAAKSTEGLSLLMFGLQFSAFATWSAYGFLKPDYYIVLSNVPGVLGVAIILGQCAIYRGQKPVKQTGG
jgi:uncharacterized protein with PQ loop repeat